MAVQVPDEHQFPPGQFANATTRPTKPTMTDIRNGAYGRTRAPGP